MQHSGKIRYAAAQHGLTLPRKRGTILIGLDFVCGEETQQNQGLSVFLGRKEHQMRDMVAQDFERAIAAQSLIEINAKCAARINAQLGSLNPTTLYCSKTGQPVSELAPQVLADTLAIHGRDGLEMLLYEGNLATVHPAWRMTALVRERYNEILDKLCETFPQAGCAYLLGQVVRAKHKGKFTREQAVEFHWQLARAYQYLGFLPHEKLSELCDVLCHFAAYMPLRRLAEIIGADRICADILANKARWEDLIPDLERAVERHHESNIEFTVANNRPFSEMNSTDASEFLTGPQHIRLMRHAKAYAEKQESKRRMLRAAEKERALAAKAQARIDNKLGDFARAFVAVLSESDVIPGQEAWRARFAPKVSEHALTLAEIGALPLEAISLPEKHFGDMGDDVVEMRRLSPEEYRAHEIAKATEEMNKNPSISPKDRFARLTTSEPEAAQNFVSSPITQTEKPAKQLPAFLARRLGKA